VNGKSRNPSQSAPENLPLLISAALLAVQLGIAGSVVSAQAIMAEAAAGSSAADLLSSSSPMDAGYRDMYNLDFDAAHRAFQISEKAHPAIRSVRLRRRRRIFSGSLTKCTCWSRTFSWTTTNFFITTRQGPISK
jgi:hypothetical protein